VTELLEIVLRLEVAGGMLTLDGERIRYSIPSGDTEARGLLAELRERKPEVTDLLRARAATPPGVRIIGWNLKEPPIAIEYHAVVTDPAKFARATLGELRQRLTNPKRKYGWTVPQLIDRLGQVGVKVALGCTENFTEANP
jgi:hypothetical protein